MQCWETRISVVAVVYMVTVEALRIYCMLKLSQFCTSSKTNPKSLSMDLAELTTLGRISTRRVSLDEVWRLSKIASSWWSRLSDLVEIYPYLSPQVSVYFRSQFIIITSLAFGIVCFTVLCVLSECLYLVFAWHLCSWHALIRHWQIAPLHSSCFQKTPLLLFCFLNNAALFIFTYNGSDLFLAHIPVVAISFELTLR